MVDGTRLDYSIFAQPYTSDKDDLIALLHPTETNFNLGGRALQINQHDKFTGKRVWISDDGRPVWAEGPLPADKWWYCDGTLAFSPE